MTVNTKKITSGPYAGNGIADTFSYTFKVFDKTDLKVYETDDEGNQVTLVVDTDYTVNSVGNDTGGTIVRTAGPLPTGYEWYIRSSFEETQLTAFTSQGAFFPDLHEDAVDKLTLLLQQLIDDKGRSPTLDPSYSGDLPLSLENPVAGLVLRWKADLTGIENFDTEATYVNITGDTMLSPLAGPPAISPNDYMPQVQVTQVIDDRVSSVPGFDPENFQDYGLVTEAVSDSNDYGSI